MAPWISSVAGHGIEIAGAVFDYARLRVFAVATFAVPVAEAEDILNGPVEFEDISFPELSAADGRAEQISAGIQKQGANRARAIFATKIRKICVIPLCSAGT